jgi:hypothetical protein
MLEYLGLGSFCKSAVALSFLCATPSPIGNTRFTIPEKAQLFANLAAEAIASESRSDQVFMLHCVASGLCKKKAALTPIEQIKYASRVATELLNQGRITAQLHASFSERMRRAEQVYFESTRELDPNKSRELSLMSTKESSLPMIALAIYAFQETAENHDKKPVLRLLEKAPPDFVPRIALRALHSIDNLVRHGPFEKRARNAHLLLSPLIKDYPNLVVFAANYGLKRALDTAPLNNSTFQSRLYNVLFSLSLPTAAFKSPSRRSTATLWRVVEPFTGERTQSAHAQEAFTNAAKFLVQLQSVLERRYRYYSSLPINDLCDPNVIANSSNLDETPFRLAASSFSAAPMPRSVLRACNASEQWDSSSQTEPCNVPFLNFFHSCLGKAENKQR